jgi:hypothetical protein
MGFLLLSDHTDLQLSDLDVAVGTVEMRVHPGTGLQFQKVFICVERPDSREGRVEVAHDRLCASAQNLSLLGDVHHRANILEVTFFISYSLSHHVDVLDRSIRHEESMFKIQIRPGLDSAIESLLYAGDVFRMNPLEHQFECWLSR